MKYILWSAGCIILFYPKLWLLLWFLLQYWLELSLLNRIYLKWKIFLDVKVCIMQLRSRAILFDYLAWCFVNIIDRGWHKANTRIVTPKRIRNLWRWARLRIFYRRGTSLCESWSLNLHGKFIKLFMKRLQIIIIYLICFFTLNAVTNIVSFLRCTV